MSLDLSRREFMQVGTVSIASLGTGSNLQIQGTEPAEEYEFQGAAHLVGPGDARPAPGDAFFDNKVHYAYLYEADDTGAKSFRTQDDSVWTPLNYINQQPVFDSSDLPEPQNGVHPLERKVYLFMGFVDSPYGLDISAGPALIGRHGSQDGFIHTGGATAIYGRGGGVFMRDCYIHAPSGQIFDVAGDQSTEMLAESCAFSDAAGLGNIADLGTFDGLRVPTFKGCNFEDFDAGLTFTGTPDKVFVSNSPLRGVTASGVTILEFDANLSVAIVDLPNNYVKDVQSDTEVVNVDPNATINEIFQYVKNTHDASVNPSNILTGAASTEAVGYRVKNSFPIVDSVAVGNYSLDSTSTATISIQAANKNDDAAYVRVPGSTTGAVDIRWTLADNEATYKGKKNTRVRLSATLSVGTANGDTVAAAWFRNGAIVDGTPTRVATRGQGNAVEQPTTAVGICPSCTTDDTYDIRVANLDSTDDIDVGETNGSLEADV